MKKMVSSACNSNNNTSMYLGNTHSISLLLSMEQKCLLCTSQFVSILQRPALKC